MKKQTWILLLLAIAGRCLSLFVLNSNPFYIFVPRSFSGGAVLVQPGWLDLAVPFVFVLVLWTSLPKEKWAVQSPGWSMLDALWILAFPLLTGLTLFLYVQRWLLTPMLNWATLLHWVQFMLTFVAINLFMDSVSVQNRWARRGLALTVTGALALTQDVMISKGSPEISIVALLSSPGVLLGLTALAMRRIYRQAPSRTVLTAALVGGVVCFFVIGGRSESIFTLFLPALAMYIGALTIRSTKRWPRWIALCSFLSAGLLLSLLLPGMLPPEIAQNMAENSLIPAHTETVDSLIVSYDDPRVRDMAMCMARVLKTANQVSRETFGVSPEVEHLTIGGIVPGGFHAEYPNSIMGNFPSERFLQLGLDKAYLNAPQRSASDVDPVNMILHEYAHLYGIVPYEPWIMGSEDEGWATYAATRLSLRLYEKYGAALWDPPYDYAERARAITKSNLQGHAVAWSHPDEFGGFKMWYALGRRDGEVTLFRERWDMTRRDADRALMVSNPGAARQFANSFGETDFEIFGKSEPVRYDQSIVREEFVSSAEMLGIPADQVKAIYDRHSNQVIEPGVHVPRSNEIMHGMIALGVLAGGVTARYRMRRQPG